MSKKYKYKFLEPNMPTLKECLPFWKDIYKRQHYTNNGYYCQKLEEDFSKYLSVKHCILTDSGTSALLLGLKSLNLEGEVLVPSFTFPATVHAIMWNNLTPVFVDVDPDYWTIDPKDLQSKITKNTCAIMPVSTFGIACDNAALKKIAKDNNLKLIYDSAAALGATYNYQNLGSFGDLECFSLHATKVCAAVEGGLIATNNDELAVDLKRLRNFGLEDFKVHNCGLNAKISELHAAVGILSLNKIKEGAFLRGDCYHRYKKCLNDIKEIKLQKQRRYGTCSHQSFSILVENRDELKAYLDELEIQTRIYYSPLMHQTYNPDDSCPITEEIHDKILCLPFHVNLNKRSINYISKQIKDFYA